MIDPYLARYMRELAWYQAEQLHYAEKRIHEHIERKGNEIMSEVSDKLEAQAAQLAKVYDEVVGATTAANEKIQNLTDALEKANVTDPDVLKAVDDIQTQVDRLDALNPDTPPADESGSDTGDSDQPVSDGGEDQPEESQGF